MAAKDRRRARGSRSHLDRFKPKGYEGWFTLGELCLIVDRDRAFLARLEKEDRLPIPKRIKRGKLQIRLFSPQQVEECKEIIAGIKMGRPRNVDSR